MSKLLPALQKFYNALKHLEQFSLESSFFDNIGALDAFLSEYRSTTLVLQESLGGNSDPIYQKNLSEYLTKDEMVIKWLNDQRVNIIHRHPFRLKKVLKVVVYSWGNAIEYKRFEQTVDQEQPFVNYEQLIRNTFMSIAAPEINFSVQYLFFDESDSQEINIFDIIEAGITAMWLFLRAMKTDLGENGGAVDKLMREINEIYIYRPQRWICDAIDYCYYRTTDSFERGQIMAMIIPDARTSVSGFINMVKESGALVSDFWDSFVWMHSWIYIQQKHNIMSTFFIEYEDGSYRTIPFLATLRTTMYRYINKVAKIATAADVVNVYLVTEMVSYTIPDDGGDTNKFLQLNYHEKESFRTITFLSFFRVSCLGIVSALMIDAEDLVDRVSISTAMGDKKNKEVEIGSYNMLSPIIKSFKERLNRMS